MKSKLLLVVVVGIVSILIGEWLATPVSQAQTNEGTPQSSVMPGMMGNMDAMHAQMPGMMGNMDAMHAQMPGMMGNMDAMHAQMPGMMGNMDAMHAQMPGMMGNMDAMHTQVITAVATTLGMTGDALLAELEAGNSIAQVAEAQGTPIDDVLDVLVSIHSAQMTAHMGTTPTEDTIATMRTHLTEMVNQPGMFTSTGCHHEGTK